MRATPVLKLKSWSASPDERKVYLKRWGIAVILTSFLGVGSACGGAPRSEPTPLPNAAAVHQNDRILQSIPPFPGAQLEGRNNIDAPRGGKGAGSYLYYRSDADRAAIVDHFKANLAGWSVLQQESFPARRTVTFIRGDAWFQVSAENVAGSGNAVPVPGYVVVVNARDAKVLTPSR